MRVGKLLTGCNVHYLGNGYTVSPDFTTKHYIYIGKKKTKIVLVPSKSIKIFKNT